MSETTGRDRLKEQVAQAFAIQAEAMRLQQERLTGDELIRAAEMLMNAPVIGASACGHSGIACMHFAHLMCWIGKAARFISPAEAVHGGLGFLQPGGVMMLASRGGKTAELVPIQEYCAAHQIKTIAVTENTDSALAQKADAVLPMTVNREIDRYNCQGTTSFLVTAAIFEALQMIMIELTGFTKQRFAEIHPGGAVGARLNGGAK